MCLNLVISLGQFKPGVQGVMMSLAQLLATLTWVFLFHWCSLLKSVYFIWNETDHLSEGINLKSVIIKCTLERNKIKNKRNIHVCK